MKLLIPTLALCGVYAETQTGGIPSDDNDDSATTTTEVDPTTRRISFQYRTLMAARLAEEYPALAGETILHKLVNRVLRDYGCNCFQRPRVHNSESPSVHAKGLNMCQVGGTPVDDMDAVCLKYARVYACLERETGTSYVSEWTGYTANTVRENVKRPGRDGQDLTTMNRPNRVFTKCGAHVPFDWHADSSGVHCGPTSDPNFASRDANDCELLSCEVAMAMIDELLVDPRWEDPRQFQRDNIDAGMYSLAGSCVKQGGRSDECCGEYPDRIPYLNDSQCCDGVGEVRQIGQC